MARDVKFINMVVHDAGQGFGLWGTSPNVEVYGCLICYNGYQSDLRGRGHGVHMQNKDGFKRVEDNIIFNQFHTGIHAYGGSDAQLKNMTIAGNVLFHNGMLQRDPNGAGILVGGTNQAEDIVIRENYLYNPLTFRRGVNLNPAYRSGVRRPTMERNYSAGRAADGSAPIVDLTASGNEFYGDTGQIAPALFNTAGQGNSFERNQPTKNRLVVRPNRYEAGRAHAIVFNWEKLPRVQVDLSGAGLKEGDAFEVLDAQNYFGPAVAAGVFRAQDPVISLATGLTAISEPVDAATLPNRPAHTSPEFNVVVVRKAAPAPRRATPPAPAARGA